MNEKIQKLKYKIEDRMLLGSIYDNIIKKLRYNQPKTNFLYNVMVAQKHRMIYYHMLKRKYYRRCTMKREWESKEKIANKDTIWFMWLQGYDDAPEIVKRCYESIQKNFPDKKLIFLDKDNIWEYISMPDYVVEKWKSGVYGNAHFSDLVRLELLINRGGLWIDSTVLCTDGSIVDFIEKNDLFMYSFYYFGFNPEIMELNSWFMYSVTNNNILCLTRDMLYEYWKDNNRLCEYFLIHLFMTLATEYYEDEYKKMPIISQVDSHVLATYIYDKFDQNKYDILKKTTGIHKLSTRFEKDKLKEGTFYDIVIKQGKY